MSFCKECDLNNICPRIEGGAFCTKFTGPDFMRFHPAAVDPQNAALSCEMRDFYEIPSLEMARESKERGDK